jgi:hypothetical protein
MLLTQETILLPMKLTVICFYQIVIINVTFVKSNLYVTNLSLNFDFKLLLFYDKLVTSIETSRLILMKFLQNN